MTKVITYGTYDLLHYGHVRLLERAKALGDYLIVGVTADGFDMARGKINVQQSLMERMEAVRATGLADEVIVEEYEGQKIDDILRYDVDIFAIGSDWIGKFDYLNNYCRVVYLERTAGVSSTELRSSSHTMRMGIVGDENELPLMEKFERESHYVNGVSITGICVPDASCLSENLKSLPLVTDSFMALLKEVDAVYIISGLASHYKQIMVALQQGKHVLCESPIAQRVAEWEELTALAHEKGLVLMDAIRTAYATAYQRMLLIAKSGRVGNIVSVDVSCSSLRPQQRKGEVTNGSLCAWGPNALLPVFQLLGVDYDSKQILSLFNNNNTNDDLFTKVSIVYPHAVASVKVGKGVKTEGELVVSGTTGYIYVPAPWWKTDYFEIRREDPSQNKRYFYQLEGEGIRYEIVSFLKAVNGGKTYAYINECVSRAIVSLIEDFFDKNVTSISRFAP